MQFNAVRKLTTEAEDIAGGTTAPPLNFGL